MPTLSEHLQRLKDTSGWFAAKSVRMTHKELAPYVEMGILDKSSHNNAQNVHYKVRERCSEDDWPMMWCDGKWICSWCEREAG